MTDGNGMCQGIGRELSLVLGAANNDLKRTETVLRHRLNWDVVFRLAKYHRVYPLLYKTLNQLNNSAIPEEVLALLREECREGAVEALSMAGETIRIVECLERRGIRVLVLKGAPLARSLYGDVTVRPSGDIDILVSPDDVDMTDRVLESEGYRHLSQAEVSGIGLTLRQVQIYNKIYPHPHHFTYRHDEKRIVLELHWTLGHGADEVLTAPFDDKIKRVEIGGSSLPVFSDENLLVYLMLHGAGHAWFRLQWLVDITKFSTMEIDWERIRALGRRFRVQHVLHHALILANQLLAMPLPPGYRSVIVSDRQAWRLSHIVIKMHYSVSGYEIVRRDFWRYLYDFHVRVGWGGKFRYAISLLSPAISDIKSIPLPVCLYRLYYIMRPFTLLCQLFRER